MSTSIYKVEYECDCGVDYGNCGAKCAVILKSHNTVDVYSFYHTDSHKYKGNHITPKTELGLPSHFTDSLYDAIQKVMSPDCKHNGQDLTESECIIIKEN